MKCNPIRWLWGVLPIAGLALLAAFWEKPRIEADLGQRVAERMRSAGFTWANSKFSGRDVQITGRASDEADPQRAVDQIRTVWGVGQVANNAELIERADRYQWSANRTGSRIVLRGFVPSETARRSVLGTARTQFPDGDVVDEMKLARGVPSQDAWMAGVSFGLKQLNGLKSGEARMDDLGYSISGEASTQATYRTVKTALQNEIPRGVSLRDDRVTAPPISPYVWSVRYSGSEVQLTGYVPDDRARSQIVAQARALPRNPRVTDRMEIGAGAPATYLAATTLSLRELARLEDGTASLRDQSLSLEGMAPDEQTANTTRREFRNGAPQGMRLSEQIRFREPPPPPQPVAISPYTGDIEADDGRVVLTGYVPSAAVQSALNQAARTRFPGRQIDDRLTIGPGAPDGWQRCFDGALLGLARVGGGRAQLVDRRLDVMGRTDDEDLAAAVPNDVRSSVQGSCDANVRIDTVAPQEPDRVWRANYDGSTVVLSGEVTSNAVRQSLLQQARRQFTGNVRVVDEMRVTENKSRNWPRAAEAGLAALTDLQRGEAVLERQRLTVTGEARYDPNLIARVKGDINRALPRGYSSDEQIAMNRPPQPVQPPTAVTPPPPQRQLTVEADRCQSRLRDAARSGVINCERARADLTSDSTQTLNRIAEAARQCPRVRIEIEGHTDAEGTPERNQRLSERRASAVVQYLTRAGVDSDVLKAIGYGETRPVAPNDTADNRARNRRIEFTVVE